MEIERGSLQNGIAGILRALLDQRGTSTTPEMLPTAAPKGPLGPTVQFGTYDDLLRKLLGVQGQGSSFGVNAMKNIGPDSQY